MPKKITIDLSASEVEAMQNIFKHIKSPETEPDAHIYLDVITLDAILRRADQEED